MPELQRFDASRPLDWEKVWRAFDQDGGLIVEHFIAEELLARLRADFAPLISSHEPVSNS